MSRVVAIVSGGLDSTVLAYQLAEREFDLTLVSFDYGQRHRRELAYAARTADNLNARHHVVDLSQLGSLLPSALTDTSLAVPHGHYADENMRATVVPNRNLIMLAIAGGIAQAEGAHLLATGVHAGDHPIYPDCRPEFIQAASGAISIATGGVTVTAPFVGITKDAIVRIGYALCVPFRQTWSCYEGRSVHCGECGTCVERREAFQLADVPDPTDYSVTGPLPVRS